MKIALNSAFEDSVKLELMDDVIHYRHGAESQLKLPPPSPE
jgi:hypothetical protein